MTEGRITVSLLGLAIGLALSATPAGAEPHFSVRTGLRCSRCHVSPTGGGKRTAYGALYAQTTLVLGETGPRARGPVEEPSLVSSLQSPVAVGEVTDWMAVGADLRVANTTTFLEERRNTFEATEGTLYLELRPWPERVVLYADEEIAVGGARSREAWALLRGPWSTYLRGGRLLPPFGLRLLDDAAFTRRVTGANFANPDLGLEAGFDLGPLFFAAALTNGSFSSEDQDTLKAVWGLLELNLPSFRIGVSGAHNPSEAGCRSMAGVFAGVRLGRAVLQAELDFVTSRPADSPRWVQQLAGMAELDLLVTKGLSLRAAWDATDGDLELGQDRRQRFRLGVDLFPLRMVEAKLYYVIQQSELEVPEENANLLEVVLHVYL